MRLKKSLAGAVAAVLALGVMWGCAQEPPASRNASPEAASPPMSVELDLDKAVAVDLPKLEGTLKPASFRTSDGREGWAVQIPGNLPLATPAYADGMLFIGGGYGSHEFYAFDAQTGALVWQIATGDDGPTAAVVEDGCVAFNTESCTVIVAEAKTGKILWQEWLGDPLMSQPAIWKGRLYMAYPAGQRAGPAPENGRSHRLLCADLRTGKHLWDCAITGDVITAPVVAGGKCVFTCFDGTSFCVDATEGKVEWEKRNSGTSAPVVAGERVILTTKEMRDGRSFEGIQQADMAGGGNVRNVAAREEAKYIDRDKGGGVAMDAEAAKKLDGSVGFASAPEAAKLGQANDHVGVQTVAGAWAYQGSKVLYARGQMMNAQGRTLNCLRESGGYAWRAECRGAGVTDETQVFSPPALGREHLYLCSGMGHLASVRQKDGAIGFLYATKAPMLSQPALAEGNLYVGTSDGRLVCLKTGSSDADGWTAWGGNAQHNKTE
ncbi:MAG: PQQ-binding-like beta-propeller repeat protein [Planctomycetes bacterium]|nr:PQQ-binding-like beta-propeller repeat protein [Planctomycetota bacterium]